MKMFALIQSQDGYSGKSEGPQIASCDPWLEPASIEVPELLDGQVLVKLSLIHI